MIKKVDESIFIDFIYSDGEIPDGYRAYYYIRQNETIFKSSEISKSLDNKSFELRIKAGELEEIKPERYKLEVAVINENVGYKDYIYNEDLILKGA